ncbi:GNAT family N-acetyltransferase [Thalassobacillus sp. C254]|uniref:GNAT family N-acetyltransferase n=1 Tax=Thalassobacillus sp. C254 TaxID=1225341 RepID=UPI0006CF31B2|nr:GNAT family N-acetyltransferase [Thalassobacillus sp. C254]
MNETIVIDWMTEKDWEQVRTIYEEGIATGNATFETNAPAWEKWDEKHARECRLVVRSATAILGWAALTPVSNRNVYAGVAEVSIYISKKSKGMGVGSRLLAALIAESEKQGYWTLQSGIFPENTASLRLHKKHGFREVGRRERIGKMNGVWRDTVLLERRSVKIGMDDEI